MRALLSASDKTGLTELGAALAGFGWDVLATGGSARALAEAGVPVRPATELAGPELFDGRVKTLHDKVFSGLLYRRDRPGHEAEAASHGIEPIDLVACNFYPFARRAACGGPVDTLLDSVDVGGPAMVRAAAKNHQWVIPLVDPADYASIVDMLRASCGAVSGVPVATRRALAAKAFRVTSALDAEIARVLTAP